MHEPFECRPTHAAIVSRDIDVLIDIYDVPSSDLGKFPTRQFLSAGRRRLLGVLATDSRVDGYYGADDSSLPSGDPTLVDLHP